MASLILNNQIELLNYGVVSTLPSCAGATFYLAPAYDLGSPVPVVDIVGELSLDGERPFGSRSSNRNLTLPIVITAPDVATLAGARETLIALIDQPAWTLTWTRDGGQPLVFDCFRAAPAVPVYSVARDRQLACQITVSFQALPFGRAAIPVQLTFASPTTGSPPPPPMPVLLDDYETPSGAHWSASAAHVTGSFSAHWTAPSVSSPAPKYSSTFSAADVTNRGVLQHWAGFAAPVYWWIVGSSPQPFSFAYTLFDSHGRTLSFGASVSAVVSAAVTSPNWYQISAVIPSSGTFDYTTLVRVDITISNYSGTRLDYVDAFLDDLTAQPTTTGAVASVRGSLYTLHGIQGTSHAPLALQLEQPAASSPTVVTITAAGAGTFTPLAGVTSLQVEKWAGSAAGGSRTTSGQASGSKGGEYTSSTVFACLPGVPVSYLVGAGGVASSTAPTDGGDTWFGANDSTAAHASVAPAVNTTAAVNTAHGVSSDPVHFAGGSPAGGATTGGGGGESGGPPGAGNAGSNPAGGTGHADAGDGGAGGAAGIHAGANGIAPGGGAGGASTTGATTLGGNGAAGQIRITYTVAQPVFEAVIAHRPGPDSPANLTPFCSVGNGSDVPNGGTQYTVVSQVAGQNARFAGTYTIVAVASSFSSPSSARTVSVTVSETEYPGGPVSTSVTDPRTFVPSADISNGVVVLGELTLPALDIPPDNTTMFHTVSIADSNTSDRYLDVLFLDTTGQTVIINSPTAYAAYYLDIPTTDRDIGRVLGSNLDRTQAISVLDNAFISGGPLTVDPADNVLLVYSPSGAPSLIASYSPAYYLDNIS